jgi:hypothetical protein
MPYGRSIDEWFYVSNYRGERKQRGEREGWEGDEWRGHSIVQAIITELKRQHAPALVRVGSGIALGS